MSIQERKVRQKEEVRGAILHAAWSIAEKEGWEAVSLRKIADIIEYSAPLIYSYFKCKEAILLEFVKDGYLMQYQAMKKAKEKHPDPAQQLKEMAVAGWKFAVKKQEYYQLMYGVKVVPCETQQGCFEVSSGRHNLRDLVFTTIEALIARSDRPETNPELKYFAFWSILHGLASLYITRTDHKRVEDYRMILEDAIEGIIRTLDQ